MFHGEFGVGCDQVTLVRGLGKCCRQQIDSAVGFLCHRGRCAVTAFGQGGKLRPCALALLHRLAQCGLHDLEPRFQFATVIFERQKL